MRRTSLLLGALLLSGHMVSAQTMNPSLLAPAAPHPLGERRRQLQRGPIVSLDVRAERVKLGVRPEDADQSEAIVGGQAGVTNGGWPLSNSYRMAPSP